MTLFNTVLHMVLYLAAPADTARMREVAYALFVALRDTPRAVRPSPAVVVAIAWHESRFNPKACAEDRAGGASRGLMQIRTPHSRCGDGANPMLFDPVKNARMGVQILQRLIRETNGEVHRALYLYSGGSRTYATRVMATAEELVQHVK